MLTALRSDPEAGVSLVESMVVLAVSAIVLAAGAPSLGRWVRDLEVRSSAGVLHAALQAARAEAVARNASVRLELGDEQGRTAWTLSCVRVSAQCPARIRRQPASQATGVRWGASPLSGMPAYDTALVAGAGMPASVSFDALGTAPAIATGTDVARVDVIHANGGSIRRLVVQVSAQGMARICDPAALDHPAQCH